MNRTGYVAVKFLTELLAITALYVFPFERRRRFWLRLTACLALCYAFSFFTSPVFILDQLLWPLATRTLFTSVRYSGIFFSLILSVWVCFDVNFKAAAFVCSGAYAIQYLVLKLQNFLEEFYIGLVPLPAAVVLYTAFVLGCYTLAYVLILLRLQREDYVRLKSRDSFRFSLFIILCLSVPNVFSGDLTAGSLFDSVAPTGHEVMCSVLLLYIQFGVHAQNTLERENEQIEHILAQEQKRFEAFRAESAYLDIKCHDLKHQIHKLKTQSTVSAETIAELESDIAAYESYARTGCAALDIILGEKYLQCANHGIPFTASVFSGKLDHLSESDIYSLFGNALDNAIEYEQTLPGDVRFIRLSVRDIGNMLLIRAENSYPGPPLSVQELHTTKTDTLYHGFGLKSMRYIAAKYGGEMEVAAHDGVFCLTFVFTFP